MDVKEYIASGILELYIAGLLSEEENLEVHALTLEYPEIQNEIEAIEVSILTLSKTVSTGLPLGFDIVRQKIEVDHEVKVVDLKKKDINWTWYMGWAASVVLSMGLFWMYTQNRELQSQVQIAEQENLELEQQIADADTSLEQSQKLLQTIRDKDISVVTLGGQTVSPTSYAKAYWNKTEQKVFIDAQGLPEPPNGFVYQVWSLKLNPLTPTRLGVLAGFNEDANKVFALANVNESEAFGITLEPEGGSETPNLEQLYTLGTVSTS